MIKAREWPMRAIYILIAAALALSLFITAAPAHKVSAATNNVEAEWEMVSTPTMDGFVLAPDSTIIDYALADGGEVAYAVVEAYDEDFVDGNPVNMGYRLLKSTDDAATWKDITDALEDVLDDNVSITWISQVATDWEDPDFVAVALALNVSVFTPVHVFFSTNGGTTFNDADEVEDGGVDLDGPVSDLAVSLPAAGKRDIAIGGIMCCPDAALFRCTVTGDSASAWEDATAYAGWDNWWTGDTDGSDDLDSWAVTDIIFSPNWANDKTILVTTIEDALNDYYVYLQSGSWGTTEGWNKKSTLGIPAVRVSGDVDMPTYLIGLDVRGLAGITLPSDYNSKSIDTRVLWVWYNYYDPAPPNEPRSQIVRVDNDDSDPVIQQVKDGEVWLTNVSYLGTIAEGQALAGVLGTGSDVGGPLNLITGCGVGVSVYRNAGIHNMDICCERWKKACKPPTGRTAMAVSFVSEDKAYAVALQGDTSIIQEDFDEGAWSVTFDGGDTWNQLSLIDTYIHYFSDVAVSPDCNKMMLVSVNAYEGPLCQCDSVWLNAKNLPEAQEYSGKWLRTWCGSLMGYWTEADEGGLLRLAPEETTGDTVYLVDMGSGNVYRNDLETLGCWTSVASTTVDEIVDLVATDADTLWALDINGDVSMYDEEGWHEAVSSEIDTAWTIAVHGEDILVGAMKGGYVSYSDDGGETFTLLEETPTIDGKVTVAFDTYFDTNNIIYAAVEDYYADGGGIYRWVLGETDSWEDTGADHDLRYTGLVLDRPSPANPKTSADTGGVLYASYVVKGRGESHASCDWLVPPECDTWQCQDSGVARSLNPAETIECQTCVEWDYLIAGLPTDYDVGFEAAPKALKICGCLEATSNSKLYAIDSWDDYDMDDGEEGTVWTFEDCYAKKAPAITSPSSNTTIPADPCSCFNAPFTVNWGGLCDACHYELQFALDQAFTSIFKTVSAPREGSKNPTSYFAQGGEPGPEDSGGLGLSCETTYYMRVRAYQAGTCQIIRSWWSEPMKITIAPSVGQAVLTLVAPAPGASDVAIKNVGFSWNLLADANKFDWVLSKNADLSTPLDSKTGLTTKAASYSGTLAYDTTYYWQVKAYKDGVAVSTSAIGTFTTAATGKFCCPLDGLCFDTRELLQAHNAEAHPAQPATPLWVWVVIAIGAVLVIVVIVLIFRTRRV